MSDYASPESIATSFVHMGARKGAKLERQGEECVRNMLNSLDGEERAKLIDWLYFAAKTGTARAEKWAVWEAKIASWSSGASAETASGMKAFIKAGPAYLALIAKHKGEDVVTGKVIIKMLMPVTKALFATYMQTMKGEPEDMEMKSTIYSKIFFSANTYSESKVLIQQIGRAYGFARNLETKEDLKEYTSEKRLNNDVVRASHKASIDRTIDWYNRQDVETKNIFSNAVDFSAGALAQCTGDNEIIKTTNWIKLSVLYTVAVTGATPAAVLSSFAPAIQEMQEKKTRIALLKRVTTAVHKYQILRRVAVGIIGGQSNSGEKLTLAISGDMNLTVEDL